MNDVHVFVSVVLLYNINIDVHVFVSVVHLHNINNDALVFVSVVLLHNINNDVLVFVSVVCLYNNIQYNKHPPFAHKSIPITNQFKKKFSNKHSAITL